jgi:hypothetical protein
MDYELSLRLAATCYIGGVQMAIFTTHAFWANEFGVWLFKRLNPLIRNDIRDTIGVIRNKNQLLTNCIGETIMKGYECYFITDSEVMYCPEQTFDPNTDIFYQNLRNLYSSVSWYVGDGSVFPCHQDFEVLISSGQGICNQHNFRAKVKLFYKPTHEFWNKSLKSLSEYNVFFWPNSTKVLNKNFFKTYTRPFEMFFQRKFLLNNHTLPIEEMTMKDLEWSIKDALKVYELYHFRNFQFLYTPGILICKGRVAVDCLYPRFCSKIETVEFKLMKITFTISEIKRGMLEITGTNPCKVNRSIIVESDDFICINGKDFEGIELVNVTELTCSAFDKNGIKLEWRELVQTDILGINEDLSWNRTSLKTKLNIFLDDEFKHFNLFQEDKVNSYLSSLSKFLVTVQNLFLT